MTEVPDKLFYIKRLLMKCDDDEVLNVIHFLQRLYYIPVCIRKNKFNKETTYTKRKKIDEIILNAIEEYV